MRLDYVQNYMRQIGSRVGYILTGVLGLDCINNLSQGNYQMATIEVTLAAYIQAKELLVNGPQSMKLRPAIFMIVDKRPVIAPTYSPSLEQVIDIPINYFGKESSNIIYYR